MSVLVEKQVLSANIANLVNKKFLYNAFIADFETVTQDTKYFREHQATKITYGVLKKLDDTVTICFNNIKQMFDELIQAVPTYNKFKIFFHNLSFDGVFILDWLGVNGFKWDEKVKENNTFNVFRTTGSKIYSIKVCYQNKSFEFKCSKLLLSASVKQLGKSVNIDKYISESQETEEFYNVEPMDDLEAFIEKNKDYCLYCERDVEIVRLSLQSFFISLGTFLHNFGADDEWFKRVMEGVTISQVSLQLQLLCANRKGMEQNDLFLLDEYHRDTMDDFTNGGLTVTNEAYRHTLLTDLDGHVIDLKSAYPAVMRGLLPYGPMLKVPPKDSPYCTFVEVQYTNIRPKNHQIPLLKNWKIDDHKDTNYFLEHKGDYYTFLLEDEMNLLEQLYEYDEKYITQAYFFPLKQYLNDFIDYGFEMKEKYKKEGNLASSHTFKILLNSAYGIHAKRSDFKVVKGDKGEYWEDKKKSYSLSENINLNHPDRHSYIPNNELFAYNCNGFINWQDYISAHKGIANYITAKTRCKILEGILHFKPENFLYCDTDSLFLINVSEEEIRKYCGSNLGDWELEEGKEFDSAVVLRSKTYQLYKEGVEIKSGTAGIKKNALDLKKALHEKVVKVVNATLLPHRVPGGIILVPTDKLLNFSQEQNLIGGPSDVEFADIVKERLSRMERKKEYEKKEMIEKYKYKIERKKLQHEQKCSK